MLVSTTPSIDDDFNAVAAAPAPDDNGSLTVAFVLVPLLLCLLAILGLFFYQRKYQEARFVERDLSLYAKNFITNHGYQSELPVPKFTAIGPDQTFVRLKARRKPSARVKNLTGLDSGQNPGMHPTAASASKMPAFSRLAGGPVVSEMMPVSMDVFAGDEMSMEEGNAVYATVDDDAADFDNVVDFLTAAGAQPPTQGKAAWAMDAGIAPRLPDFGAMPTGQRRLPSPSIVTSIATDLAAMTAGSGSESPRRQQSTAWPTNMNSDSRDSSIEFTEPDTQETKAASDMYGTASDLYRRQLAGVTEVDDEEEDPYGVPEPVTGTFGATAAAKALHTPTADEARRRRVAEREARFKEKQDSRRNSDALVQQTKRIFVAEEI